MSGGRFPVVLVGLDAQEALASFGPDAGARLQVTGQVSQIEQVLPVLPEGRADLVLVEQPLLVDPGASAVMQAIQDAWHTPVVLLVDGTAVSPLDRAPGPCAISPVSVADAGGGGAHLAVMTIQIERHAFLRDTLPAEVAAAVPGVVLALLRQCLPASAGMVASHDGGGGWVLAWQAGGDAVLQAQALLDALQCPVSVARHHSVRLEPRAGLAIGQAAFARIDSLLNPALGAMAYTHGRGPLAVHMPALAQRHAAQRAAAEALARELAQPRSLSLVYQPVMSLDEDGMVVALDAQLRWPTEGAEVLTATRWAHVAEEAGLRDALDAWVLREACGFAAALRRGGQGVPVSVPIRNSQLMSSAFVDLVAHALSESALPSDELELVFHESAMLVMQDHREVVSGLHALGVRLVLDDMGAALSSIPMLSLPSIHGVRVDATLVQAMEHDRACARIVNAMVTLSHNLGLAVVAKGVGSPGQIEVLQAGGCLLGQGDWLAPALPPAQVSAWLRQSAGALRADRLH
ncbi:EAL domain-containing protein [uncultured Aquabacterium sp.]|jgi:EAL domain-containing protein (putative c-di-GMP-specific phosphodiesterase class I)|uniref:EAL domain-containing protein n=1 Tax=uncultured Aquabacterium sp. TaxID=158753 RepID=UPI00260885C0|nr:EAL domain-containing protein [uncultured Aquabacterium sp.]